MITLTAVLLGNSHSHALTLAQNIKSVCDGQLTALVDDNRVYCSLSCEDPDTQGANEQERMIRRLFAEIKIQDTFEEKLVALNCPFTFIEDSDTDEDLTLEDMKACDGANELLTNLYELESLRSVLFLHTETYKYAEAIDSLLPYVKKAIFSKDNKKEDW